MASPNSPNAEFNSHPAAHPPPPSFHVQALSTYHPLPTHPLLIRATHDIKVVVKQVDTLSLYLKSRHCKWYTLNIMCIRLHKLSWIRKEHFWNHFVSNFNNEDPCTFHIIIMSM